MKIHVTDIPDEGLDIACEEALEAGPVNLLSAVKARLHIDRVSSEIVVRGEARTVVDLQCSRCLKNFPRETVLPIDVVYHPAEELKGEEKHEIKEDELETGFYRGEELDIEELLAEQLLLSVPMKPLCSESCRGMCPRCGTELNSNTCRCEQKEIDPRLAVLKKLRDDGKE